jgi:hypothetical protein
MELISMPDAKEKFCEIAKDMVVEEETGIGEYSILHGYVEDWITQEQDPATQTALMAIQHRIEEINAQEQSHGRFLAVVLATYCKGI